MSHSLYPNLICLESKAYILFGGMESGVVVFLFVCLREGAEMET